MTTVNMSPTCTRVLHYDCFVAVLERKACGMTAMQIVVSTPLFQKVVCVPQLCTWQFFSNTRIPSQSEFCSCVLGAFWWQAFQVCRDAQVHEASLFW